jgi:hypothetical protein
MALHLGTYAAALKSGGFLKSIPDDLTWDSIAEAHDASIPYYARSGTTPVYHGELSPELSEAYVKAGGPDAELSSLAEFEKARAAGAAKADKKAKAGPKPAKVKKAKAKVAKPAKESKAPKAKESRTDDKVEAKAETESSEGKTVNKSVHVVSDTKPRKFAFRTKPKQG